MGDSFYYEPSEVIVNGVSKNGLCKKTCYLKKDINNITLKFNEEIELCYHMFWNCENIIYIDLSYFNAYKVINMREMFGN